MGTRATRLLRLGGYLAFCSLMLLSVALWAGTLQLLPRRLDHIVAKLIWYGLIASFVMVTLAGLAALCLLALGGKKAEQLKEYLWKDPVESLGLVLGGMFAAMMLVVVFAPPRFMIDYWARKRDVSERQAEEVRQNLARAEALRPRCEPEFVRLGLSSPPEGSSENTEREQSGLPRLTPKERDEQLSEECRWLLDQEEQEWSEGKAEWP